MSGIYIHIPFCESKCEYCNFFSSTNLKRQDEYLLALQKEITSRKLQALSPIKTIYFGGGTPSILPFSEIEKILLSIKSNYSIAPDVEITMECNPDHINDQFYKLKEIGINRISIGIQSFKQEVLQQLGRKHNSKHALESIIIAKKCGFDNISADIIYGIHSQTDEMLMSDIQQLLDFDIQHISAYSLTVEERTTLYQKIYKKNYPNIDEQQSNRQFALIKNLLEKNDFIHYEISNYCKPNFHSKHNKSYWEFIDYLGFGSSAHSYNKKTRRWNIASISKYIDKINNNEQYYEIETLSKEDIFNEYIMLSLRTNKGFIYNEVEDKLNRNELENFNSILAKYINSGHILKKGDNYILSEKGILISDSVSSEFFVE